MRLHTINENKKPYRNRVEVFATKNGKVYGGFYKDGSFGVFGGGTDGEDLETAATREFEEESGYKVKNLKKLDIEPVEIKWEGEPKSEKQKERSKKFGGTRTWYYTGELDDSMEKDKAEGGDGQSGLSDIGLKEIDDVIEKIKGLETDDAGLKKQYKARLEVLRIISSS